MNFCEKRTGGKSLLNRYKNLWLGIFLSGFILIASCSNSEKDEAVGSVLTAAQTEETTESTFDEEEVALREELVLKAKEVSYVDVDGDKYEEYGDEDSWFKLTGEVSAIGEDALGIDQQFLLTTSEPEENGVYIIKSDPPYVHKEMTVKEGETITVYGTYLGKDEDTSMPTVHILVVER